jgi:3-deoxy-D-manno-octulosonate 8-phosphate phosphatase (KDO 8-P phosphatase)
MENEMRARRIKLVAFDVDGVLTSGQIFIGAESEVMKRFHAQDGLGITAAHGAGLKTAIITGRESRIVQVRSRELHIGDVFQGTADKLTAFTQLLKKYALQPEEAAFVGDDLNDLPVLLAAGMAFAPANAVPEVKECAHFVAQKTGGNGAVREILEYILKTQGKWEQVVNRFKNLRNPAAVSQ